MLIQIGAIKNNPCHVRRLTYNTFFCIIARASRGKTRHHNNTRSLIVQNRTNRGRKTTPHDIHYSYYKCHFYRRYHLGDVLLRCVTLHVIPPAAAISIAQLYEHPADRDFINIIITRFKSDLHMFCKSFIAFWFLLCIKLSLIKETRDRNRGRYLFISIFFET